MNRKIKFRVWDNHYKYMNYKVIVGIYGDWEKVKDDENYTACSMWIEPKNVDYKCEPHWCHFEPYHKDIKLMQYTGLKDKNGVEIYEEDIVKEKNNLYIVIYSWGAFRLIPIYDYKEYMEYKKQGSEYANSFYRTTTRKFARNSEKFEQVGNIYENPELLKVGE